MSAIANWHDLASITLGGWAGSTAAAYLLADKPLIIAALLGVLGAIAVLHIAVLFHITQDLLDAQKQTKARIHHENE